MSNSCIMKEDTAVSHGSSEHLVKSDGVRQLFICTIVMPDSCTAGNRAGERERDAHEYIILLLYYEKDEKKTSPREPKTKKRKDDEKDS